MGVFGWLQADTVAAVWIAAAAIHREKNTVEAAAAAAASRSEQATCLGRPAEREDPRGGMGDETTMHAWGREREIGSGAGATRMPCSRSPVVHGVWGRP
jgi:hypothetical protein